MKSLFSCLIVCAFSVHFLFISSFLFSQEKGLNITGFGEFTYESAFGKPNDEEEAEIYEEYGYFDEYAEERHGIHFPGIGLIFTSDMFDDRLAFLGELNFRTSFTRIDLGIERCYVKYSFSDYLNLSSGIFSAPIGYLNIHQRTHGYLNYSVRPRDLVNLQLGLIPTRILGVKFDGALQLGETSSLKYIFSIGSGRDIFPERSPFEIDIFEEQESSLSIAGGLEYFLYIGATELNIGLSAYTLPKFGSIYIEELGGEVELSDLDEILEGESEEGEEQENEVVKVEYNENGIAPYLRISNEKFEFITEFHSSETEGKTGKVEKRKFQYEGFSSEFVYKTKLKGKQFAPYIRYDFIKVPENGGGPYLGLHESGTELKRFYISNNSAIMFGVNWSLFSFNRIKFEYNYILDGPQPLHAVLIQSAFTF